jgi:solute carrier family 25 phosphate transporter 23/24/25/41
LYVHVVSIVRLLMLGATYPLDLVRARLSIATANMSVKEGNSRLAFTADDGKLGMVGMTKKVYATEGGIRGL